MFRTLLIALRLATLWLALGFAALAQDAPLQSVLQDNRAGFEKPSRKTVDGVIAALLDAQLPNAPAFLTRWREKEVWQRKEDKLFFYARDNGDKTYTLIDVDTGAEDGPYDKKALKQLKPNSGVRGVIATALVVFQLTDPDPAVREAGLTAIERGPEASHLAALRGSTEGEDVPALKARKQRLERLLTITYDKDSAARVAAIESFAGDLGVDARAALNPLLTTTRRASAERPADINVAAVLAPGIDLPRAEAYALLVEAGLAPPQITAAERKAALIANIENGAIAGTPIHTLNTDAARDATYAKLAAAGLVAEPVDTAFIDAALADNVFFDAYDEPDTAVTTAAAATLEAIEMRVGLNQMADLALDGLSLASIYFLAAIGLAITFGVMGVINMAHGEFIMMGAYTGYVIQQVIPDYTVSIIVAIPVAFAVTFAAGVAMERLVIRWLYNRPLETLLATFGISIALQQLAKNIFGTQARPLTSPGWLDGALVINDVVSISYIRIAIFVLSLIFLVVLLFILNRTRLGLEVRAVTQNPRMAASMGINPDRINMLTFGLGSGIAGIAGVAIGLYAKVTSELGADYIVQSFMTVVVGGVGNIWGTLFGATMIGFLQKGIEWLNPSNTLAAQTYMIIFIIIFIQFRPKGIIALKGRAAGD
ncbi:branched-chain amino acid ABC transporter permease [Actibacterium mucosum KCTC 23349]|uniref:Branched-chain amino acid ABC transporter permease n=1 Tax=Actibacterium mucosum KCTC 23349 TaxID=1454373 RepID=A0A037ZK33_9RHOB|nr:urea ABC transporter permease subunit UrtB [Actibacterium mucosum]KAJ56448.1 branched-chain amino acid ABC transporter permease [Actibacterium mucosum KCTC 23349]